MLEPRNKNQFSQNQNFFPVILVLLLFASFFTPSIADTIQSDILKVSVCSEFPSVQEYLYLPNGAIIYGSEKPVNKILINDKIYEPTVSFSKTSDSAAYELSFDDIDVIMTVEFKVVENILNFRITSIKENGSVLVKTIEFPDQSIVSIRSTQKNPQLTTNSIVGPDIFKDLPQASITDEPIRSSYAILNTSQLAAAITNNTLDEWQRYFVTINQQDEYKQCCISNSKWIYREIDTETVELPWSKIIITADQNNDNLIDWQDGAIAHRSIMLNRFGSDLLRNSFSHIAIDFASVTQWPFLRILDNVQKLSLYTDGFPQMLLIKGYQSEGHDSAHPDYGNNFNTKAGGLDDFNFLCKKAKDFDAHIGVHINHTEAYPEAFTYTNQMVTKDKGWKWLDQSYIIDRKADIIAGNLYKRLDEMKNNAPDLSFVYVDVYSGKNWVEWKLGEKLNSLGWPVWTEFHPHFDDYYIWTHQPAGQSKIGRFIMNHQKDTYVYDKLLKGYSRRGFMGWDDGGYEKNLLEVVELFMTRNLPTKYMQNFSLLKWTDDYAGFSGGLIVKDESGIINMYKDDKLIASDNTVFIPWHPSDESKIYHWNPAGGQTEWRLPKTWQKLKSIKLYQLTDLGRVFIDDIPVSNGTVKITAKPKTPYVLYKKTAPKQTVSWSQGSLVKDMGFDSHSFTDWKKASSASNTDHIKMANDSLGHTYLHVEGSNGADAIVSQKIEGLKPAQTYSASVWLQLKGQRTAGLKITGKNELSAEKIIDKTDFICNFPNSDKNGTCYQRIKVLFDMPQGQTEATVSLIANSGHADSIAMFDDVRVIPAKRTPQADHYFFEDFENVDEGWGPFVYAYNGPCNTHLSEYHADYTDDTISGRYSLKTMDERHTGYIIRTLPSTLKLEPNTSYRMTFDYLVDNNDQYKVVIDKPFVDNRNFDKTYSAEISSANINNWSKAKGTAELNIDADTLTVKPAPEAFIIDQGSPEITDGQISFKVKADQKGRCGAVIRYSSPEKFGFIGYDTGSKWVWSAGDSYGTITNSGPNIADDSAEHLVKVRFIGSNFTVWVDSVEVFSGSLKSMPASPGRIGARNWYGSNSTYSEINLAYDARSLRNEEANKMDLITEPIKAPSGKFTKTFKTADTQDSFIAFEKLNNSSGMLVIDNFTIDLIN